MKTSTWSLLIAILLCTAFLGTLLLYIFRTESDLKQQALIEVASLTGNVAAELLERAGTERADQLHNVPISVQQINDHIYQARGIGNTHVITTRAGHVVFDTGLSIQAARQLQLLREVLPAGAISHIIVSHSHADHSGGVKFWRQPETQIIAHRDFEEEQRYLTELQPYFWSRNRLLFPFMPEAPPTAGLFAYGGVVPDLTVADWEVHRFAQGGVQFEVYGTPGAEGADNLVLWLPQERILFSGDTFGPLFPQFPNVFTMRGEKVRKPVEYLRSLDLLIDLQPAMIVPSHFAPVVGVANTVGGMQRIRAAVQHVHDAVVAGMNAGKTLYQLMDEIRLPAQMELTQGHGKVSWAVKSIWEYYATWFHFESTTELYHVPVRAVYADLATLAGSTALLARAADLCNRDAGLRDRNGALKALHLLEIVRAAAPDSSAAAAEEARCYRQLLDEARVLNNSYEIMWLQAQLDSARQRAGG